MPMRKFSTLIYFVNQIQNDTLTTRIERGEDESSLTMGGFEPSERSVKNILDFARSYDVLESEETGYIEMNLN